MRCPRCASAMTTETRRGVEIDRCARCGAVVLDRFELAASLGASSALEDALAEAARDATATGTCPRCAGGLAPVDTRAGAVELCLDCGTLAVDVAALRRGATDDFRPAGRTGGFDRGTASDVVEFAASALDFSDLAELLGDVLSGVLDA